MKLPVRQRPADPLPGVQGTARVERRTSDVLSRVRPGDIVVVDQVDLDRASALSLVQAGAAALVNASPMISGRFPNLGPQALLEAGLTVVDGVGTQVLSAVSDGDRVRVHDGQLLLDEQVVAQGRDVDAELVQSEMAQARTGMSTQLESFVHNSAAFLQREQDVLLNGLGAPTLRTRVAGRPVVVVVGSLGHQDQLVGLKAFIREQKPVLIGVEQGADALVAKGYRPDVVVLDGRRPAADSVSASAVRVAKDVVVGVDRGGHESSGDQLDRWGIRPLRFETSATAEDVALLLAHGAGASVMVGVGMHATLEEFLDRQRPGLASTYLTRLKVGPRLVDATTLPLLYAGRVRPWHLFLVLLAGLVAMAAAIAVTPVGRQWVDEVAPHLQGLFDDLQGLIR